MALLGLDVGTTGCKCSIFDETGRISAYSYREYAVTNPGPGMFELNPDDVWESVKYVIGTAVSRYSGDKITAICVSSFGEAGIPIDSKGRGLASSFIYTDIRGDSQCRWLTGKLGLEKIMRLTGVRAHPMYTISKVMWIRENLPDVYKETWKFMLFEDFINYRLANVDAIDWSLASRTMAFNVSKKAWDEEILEASRIRPDIFSTAYRQGTVVGSVKDSVAQELGLPKGVKLVTGGHDQVCAAIGAGVINEGMAIYGMGTVECITPVFDKALLGRQMLDNNFACVPYAIDGKYITYAFNFTGGSLLKWYRDNFAMAEKLEAQQSGESVYAILDRKASKTPTGILVLPHFAGAGTPYMDTGSRGAIVGLGFDNDSSEVYRALLEGVTYEMLYNIECLENAGIPVNELRAVGGGAKSDLWLKIKADILGRRIITLNVDEAGTLGTAILAGTATGMYKSLEDAVEMMVKVKGEYYPDEKHHGIYMENYAKYKRIYKAVKEILT